MTLWERIYPKAVSFLGSLGLGTAITYLFGVSFCIWSESQAWGVFFLTYGPWLVVVPAGLLMAHLYLRTHLGRWYLERGKTDKALEYTESRFEHSWLRSRKETLFHRLYFGRAKIIVMAYPKALEVLTQGGMMPKAASLAAKFRRWQMEAALRLEDGKMLRDAWSAASQLDVGPAERAVLRACMVEGAALEEKREEYQKHLEEARWLQAAAPRIDFAAAVGTAQFGKTDADAEYGIELLDRTSGELRDAVPGRMGEIRALNVEFLMKLGRNDKARRAFGRVGDVPADERSRCAIKQARERLGIDREREEGS